MVEKIGGDQRDHTGVTAAVVPQIKDDRIRVVQRGHRCRCRLLAEGRIRKRIKFQIADMVRQDLDRFEGAVCLFHRLPVTRLKCRCCGWRELDRKSTRLNSSHVAISYAVFCLKKKKNKQLY